jgi:hypothetical protein
LIRDSAGNLYGTNERRTPPHQRAAMMVDLLDRAHDMTAEQAIGIAFSPQVWHAELWQERIRKAAPDSDFAKTLAAWDRRSDADSRPALAFYLFKTSLDGGLKPAHVCCRLRPSTTPSRLCRSS